MEGEEAEVWLTVRETRGLFCSVGQGGVGGELEGRIKKRGDGDRERNELTPQLAPPAVETALLYTVSMNL